MEWYPSKIHDINCITGDLCVLLLNHPTDSKLQRLAIEQWKKSILRIAVDGGAINSFKNFKDEDEEVCPHIICGDLDSVTEDILLYYQNKGVLVVETRNQDETDFTKALRIASSNLDPNNTGGCDGVLAVSFSGGRMDHVLGNIDTLFHAQEIVTCPVYLLTEQSLSWLLPKGYHIIYIDESIINKHCGIIPIGSPCHSISTTGLKWNLVKDRLEFGKLISSCNKYDSLDNIVTIETDSSVLWTMEL